MSGNAGIFDSVQRRLSGKRRAYLGKDDSPLKRRTVQALTLMTVTELGIQWVTMKLKGNVSTPTLAMSKTYEPGDKTVSRVERPESRTFYTSA